MLIVAGVLIVALLVGAIWWAFRAPPVPDAPPVARTATPTPTPSPMPPEYPANRAVYSLDDLPAVDVFAVIAGLPVDDPAQGGYAGELATPNQDRVPVFADPTGEPVASLAREMTYDGGTVPVMVRESNWVKVLLVGRQAKPSAGNPGQLTGWLRVADVEFTASNASVQVNLSDRTVAIVRDGVASTIATDFGSGVEATPTPLGRSFVMSVRVVPEFGYTRGNPVIYLSVQSPTLDGFGGAEAAVTAFHYHDNRSGAISNGCIRVDAEAIAQLAALPHGTPVIIST